MIRKVYDAGLTEDRIWLPNVGCMAEMEGAVRSERGQENGEILPVLAAVPLVLLYSQGAVAYHLFLVFSLQIQF